MGVPQSRRRVFILAIRKDLIKNIAQSGMVIKEPAINLKFNEKKIPFSEIDCGEDWSETTRKIVPEIESKMAQTWKKTKPGSSFATVTVNKMGFTNVRIHPNLPTPTITGSPDLFHPYIMRTLSDKELQQASTFPLDYNFCDNSPSYVMGMSVPPVMIAQIAWRIKQQWIDKIK
jgi:DNA (cytosine-5)-methyltransferase 1